MMKVLGKIVVSVFNYRVKAWGKAASWAKGRLGCPRWPPPTTPSPPIRSAFMRTLRPLDIIVQTDIVWWLICVDFKQLISFAQSQHIYCNNQVIELVPPPPTTTSFSSHRVLLHKHTLNWCPVELNFSLFVPLILDAPCIALIMYLASAQTLAVSNTFECLKRQTHHREARGLVAGGISILYIFPICAT